MGGNRPAYGWPGLVGMYDGQNWRCGAVFAPCDGNSMTCLGVYFVVQSNGSSVTLRDPMGGYATYQYLG